MWHGVASSHRCPQSGRRSEQGRSFGRRGRRDHADAVPGGVFVLLPFPSIIIDFLPFPSSIRFLTINRWPCTVCFFVIVLDSCIVRFPRLVLASRIVCAVGTKRGFLRAALRTSGGPNFFLYITRFRRIPPAITRPLS
jgi:hypothetical protein